MLLKNDGYFLLELLLSLSVLLMLCLFFMPLLTDLANQYQQLVRDKKANQLLFEELQAHLLEDRTNSRYSIVHNGTEYQVFWNQSTSSGQMEVCVKVDKQILLPSTQVCKDARMKRLLRFSKCCLHSPFLQPLYFSWFHYFISY